ncbi:MAG: SUMF1/EgtB/PvdO family nonheme iron enzyme [Desulfobacteraceae bacterium]
MFFIYIAPGTYMMGSNPDEQDRGENENRHRVSISKGFYMQATEVTQGQWKKVMKTNPYARECVGMVRGPMRRRWGHNGRIFQGRGRQPVKQRRRPQGREGRKLDQRRLVLQIVKSGELQT